MEDYPLWEQNHVLLNTSDRIWDLTGRNLSQLGLDTITGFSMLMRENKDRQVFARMTGKS